MRLINELKKSVYRADVYRISYNGPAIKGVFADEGTEAVGSIYRIDFQSL